MVKVHEITIGNTLNCDKAFKSRLQTKLRKWTEGTKADCDVIVAYCPIVSRVGTDVEAAIGKIPDTKPAVLVVLHHTFDKDCIMPDTKRFVNRRDMITVNCLFHESSGLLSGPPLENALKEALDFLRCYDSDEGVAGKRSEPILWLQRHWKVLVFAGIFTYISYRLMKRAGRYPYLFYLVPIGAETSLIGVEKHGTSNGKKQQN